MMYDVPESCGKGTKKICNGVNKLKKNMKNKLFLWLSMCLMLLLAACSTAHHCNCG